MGTAYAVWTGVGTVGAAIVGMIFFKESNDLHARDNFLYSWFKSCRNLRAYLDEQIWNH
ncbi:DMT family transporter [Paenibacillus ihbetae]|uniref:DMT family transporter n=1 Tax=Paenibacillus ihbetae TaxID=1870820 RepID=UPI001CB9834D